MSIGDFELMASDGGARAGLLETAHGVVETPVFMPVGTKASVKALLPAELRDLGAQIVLGNTYHLHFRPGADLIADLGGLHRFMAWDGPILTDSGGFQVFSLRHTADRVDDDGVTFQSVYDGIAGALHAGAGDGGAAAARFRHRDGVRRVHARRRDARAARGGGAAHDAVGASAAVRPSARPGSWCSASCRERPTWRCGSAARPTSLASDLTATRSAGCRWARSAGDAGHGRGDRRDAAGASGRATSWASATRTGLLGVIERGVDMFDCVLPTRLGRTGSALVPGGRLNLRNARFARDGSPLVDGCRCPACRDFSRAYIRHLITQDEITGLRLLTVHNLHQVIELVAGARRAIVEGRFARFRESWRRRRPGPSTKLSRVREA